MRLQSWLCFWFFCLLTPQVFAENPSHLSVELISEFSAVHPGEVLQVGLRFKIEKGWHIYWQNPGDAGLAPSVTWNLPPGFKVSSIQWPIPKRIPLPSVMDYGYENEILLPATVIVPRHWDSSSPVSISAQVHWLVCKETCIPGQAALHLEIPTETGKPLDSRWKKLFEQTRQTLPQPMPSPWKIRGSLDNKAFYLSVSIGSDFSKGWFFPLKPNQIDNTAEQEFKSSAGTVQLTIKRSDQLLENVKTLQGVLVLEDEAGPKGYWVNTPISQ